MTYPFAQQVTLVARTVSGTDSYGNDVTTDTDTVITAVFAPGGSVETLAGGDTVVTQPTLYAVPLEVDVTAYDAVVVDGVTFEVDGDPQRFSSPFTNYTPGQVVRLKRAAG